MIDLFKQEQKEWKNLKQAQQRFIYVFAPKVQELLHQQIAKLEKTAAEKVLSNWKESAEIDR